MNENINEIQTQNEYEELRINELKDSFQALIYKRVNNLTIKNPRIFEAFSVFLKKVECDKSISAAEIIYSAESILKGGEPNEEAGNLIYVFDSFSKASPALNTKLLKHSYAGIYSLLAVHNGVMLDIDAIGGKITAAETKRFLVVSPKKSKKMLQNCANCGVNAVYAGKIIASDNLVLTQNGNVTVSYDKSFMYNQESTALELTDANMNAFISGYNAVCSLALCNCISFNNILRFGLGGDLSDVFARALGYFSAVMFLKTRPIRSVLINENTVSVAVARPDVADGDYLYLLKIRMDSDGAPDKIHLSQLHQYLREKKREGIIKNVLPIRENMEGLINRLSNDIVEYVSIEELPQKCFGVIVSVSRGESVNGIKLGYFRNI